jgi:hypothetical protein
VEVSYEAEEQALPLSGHWVSRRRGAAGRLRFGSGRYAHTKSGDRNARGEGNQHLGSGRYAHAESGDRNASGEANQYIGSDRHTTTDRVAHANGPSHPDYRPRHHDRD